MDPDVDLGEEGEEECACELDESSTQQANASGPRMFCVRRRGRGIAYSDLAAFAAADGLSGRKWSACIAIAFTRSRRAIHHCKRGTKKLAESHQPPDTAGEMQVRSHEVVG